MITYAIKLITKQKETKKIDGILSIDKRLIDNNLEHHDHWMIASQIIQKKYYVLAKLIVLVKITASAFNLYYNQKDYCDDNKSKVSTKNTILEYTNKIGYLSDIYV